MKILPENIFAKCYSIVSIHQKPLNISYSKRFKRTLILDSKHINSLYLKFKNESLL